MTYLTAVPLRHINTADADTMHKSIMALFPEDLHGRRRERRQSSGILWRRDGSTVLIRSAVPTLHLPEGARTRTEAVEFPAGHEVRFRLTFDASTRNAQRTRTLPLEHVPGHVVGKLADAIDDIELRGIHRERTSRHQAPLFWTTVDGAARVADPAALRAALTGGVGRSKAYGCGLLTVLPARDA